MASTADMLNNIESQFNADAASGLDVVFQFNIDDNDTYHLIVKDSQCQLVSGEHQDPSVTLIMDEDTLKEIVSGELNGMQAFMAGRLRTEGDMMLATRLSDLFSL
ncbi:SCP2 sterol-binding domain-containing protein [Saccharospirillum impatiens]|jgi:putative sterol carrier protein|uniref:SCP2 sterol-binding domain-containing protein n=1 Tax=Saccharospirillum impatiens TaxID=169438 RepID=UPI0004204680|nr:SCP2 sterol-binding domain-containing protein [Saccharospirillum impatiens]